MPRKAATHCLRCKRSFLDTLNPLKTGKLARYKLLQPRVARGATCASCYNLRRILEKDGAGSTGERDETDYDLITTSAADAEPVQVCVMFFIYHASCDVRSRAQHISSRLKRFDIAVPPMYDRHLTSNLPPPRSC